MFIIKCKAINNYFHNALYMYIIERLEFKRVLVRLRVLLLNVHVHVFAINQLRFHNLLDIPVCLNYDPVL